MPKDALGKMTHTCCTRDAGAENTPLANSSSSPISLTSSNGFYMVT